MKVVEAADTNPALLVAFTLHVTVPLAASTEVDVAVRPETDAANGIDAEALLVQVTAYPEMVAAAPELVVPGLELAVQVTVTVLLVSN